MFTFVVVLLGKVKKALKPITGSNTNPEGSEGLARMKLGGVLPLTREELARLINSQPNDNRELWSSVWNTPRTIEILYWVFTILLPPICFCNVWKTAMDNGDNALMSLFSLSDQAYAIFSLYDNWEPWHEFATYYSDSDWQTNKSKQPLAVFALETKHGTTDGSRKGNVEARALLERLEDNLYQLKEVKGGRSFDAGFVNYYRQKEKEGNALSRSKSRIAREDAERRNATTDYESRMQRMYSHAVSTNIQQGPSTTALQEAVEVSSLSDMGSVGHLSPSSYRSTAREEDVHNAQPAQV